MGYEDRKGGDVGKNKKEGAKVCEELPWQQRRALVSPAGANRDNKGALGGEAGGVGRFFFFFFSLASLYLSQHPLLPRLLFCCRSSRLPSSACRRSLLVSSTSSFFPPPPFSSVSFPFRPRSAGTHFRQVPAATPRTFLSVFFTAASRLCPVLCFKIDGK